MVEAWFHGPVPNRPDLTFGFSNFGPVLVAPKGDRLWFPGPNWATEIFPFEPKGQAACGQLSNGDPTPRVRWVILTTTLDTQNLLHPVAPVNLVC